ncbi:MAG: NifB/NifX family molybdenum-iron cluster-binding protein [Oscillospiraceae bacterium]|nr:NifB/NifX family molybdenum-iron cluster-binding protein [Oscillospiraceae bacterium]
MKLNDGFTFVAVSYGGEAEIQNFEQANAYWVYCLEGKKIQKRQLMSLYPKDFESRIGHFSDSVLDAVICRNFGPRAMQRLKALGLELYSFSGGCDAAVKAYLRGELRAL